MMGLCRVPGCTKRTIVKAVDGKRKEQPAFIYCWRHAAQFRKFMNQSDAKVRSYESASVYPMGHVPVENRVYGYHREEAVL